ncbi:MAG TPA: acetyl-CoA carboxylase biotin carboxyl carrier protein [Treponemataceae bacterium]|nr:acetyl-CoA carboxylase biotin carboxyl carrier protein [Treponemataceae bacterium]
MDEKTLLALFDKFEKSSAVEMKYSGNGNTFELRRKEAFVNAGMSQTLSPQVQDQTSHNNHDKSRVASPAHHSDVPSSEAIVCGHEYIKSPIVGTFYRSASPDAPAFAEVGKKIKKGQKICIIEAMKMMNALEAELDCEIIQILVNNGEMVEYDQPLFEIKRTGAESGK